MAALLLSGTVEAVQIGGSAYPADLQTLVWNGGDSYTLVSEWTGGLPDGYCYRIDLSSNMSCLSGDTDCMFRVLAGDINGTTPPYGDGRVDLVDMAKAKANAQSALPLTQDTCMFDVNVDGRIDLVDMALIKARVQAGGGVAICP